MHNADHPRTHRGTSSAPSAAAPAHGCRPPPAWRQHWAQGRRGQAGAPAPVAPAAALPQMPGTSPTAGWPRSRVPPPQCHARSSCHRHGRQKVGKWRMPQLMQLTRQDQAQPVGWCKYSSCGPVAACQYPEGRVGYRHLESHIKRFFAWHMTRLEDIQVYTSHIMYISTIYMYEYLDTPKPCRQGTRTCLLLNCPQHCNCHTAHPESPPSLRLRRLPANILSSGACMLDQERSVVAPELDAARACGDAPLENGSRCWDAGMTLLHIRILFPVT